MGAFHVSEIERRHRQSKEFERRQECFDLAPFTGELRDSNGYDLDGYDRDGYDKEGFDKNGYDREGYGRDGRDRYGYNRNGFNKNGYHRDDYHSNASLPQKDDYWSNFRAENTKTDYSKPTWWSILFWIFLIIGLLWPCFSP